ncbi:KGK domain-containing protein [Picosynechococcus sp. PCC 7117]|uniref:KGK domain-containing protein n=1 Tax=Picosynechococcus sp. PCC 7117 TaxID=195498 RepID=UPI000810AE05|nr:KGK domain-containing protein [Picosynechococcus sp. PCC 7117]ANV86050.1 hypothetical protein AWQ22_00365 [Picosynechococcus sp. PCC 7117]
MKNNKFQPIEKVLQADAVIDCNHEGNVYTLQKLTQYIDQILREVLASKLILYFQHKGVVFSKDTSNDQFIKEFIEEGIKCKTLDPSGGGWQKAKLRFRVVMEIELEDSSQNSDFAEASPLDDIRQSINNSEEF